MYMDRGGQSLQTNPEVMAVALGKTGSMQGGAWEGTIAYVVCAERSGYCDQAKDSNCSGFPRDDSQPTPGLQHESHDLTKNAIRALSVEMIVFNVTILRARKLRQIDMKSSFMITELIHDRNGIGSPGGSDS